MSRVLALLGLAVLLAIAAAPAGASAPRCTTAGLVVWLDTAGSGTAQGTIRSLNFTNLSGHACRLVGYPGVSAVDLHGHRIGRPARADLGHAGVTLANGATASSQFLLVNVSKFDPAACHPVTAAGLRVYPPNAFRSKVVPFPFRACSSRAATTMLVQAVRL